MCLGKCVIVGVTEIMKALGVSGLGLWLYLCVTLCGRVGLYKPEGLCWIVCDCI